MNPPFSAMANVDRRMADAALRHVTSALARLCEGGRLVAITGSSFAPDNPAWTGAFACLQERGRLVFSAAIDGAVYAKHGTTIDTRLLVIDKQPAAAPRVFPASPGIASDAATLLAWVSEHIPPRLPIETSIAIAAAAQPSPARCAPSRCVRPPFRRSPNRTQWSSLTRPSTGRRRRACASRMRFMKNTDCSRSVFPVLRRIPPSWSSRRRWPRSRRPSLHTGPHLPANVITEGSLSDAQL